MSTCIPFTLFPERINLFYFLLLFLPNVNNGIHLLVYLLLIESSVLSEWIMITLFSDADIMPHRFLYSLFVNQKRCFT